MGSTKAEERKSQKIIRQEEGMLPHIRWQTEYSGPSGSNRENSLIIR